MQFSCTQENLHRALTIVSHLATKNISLPILNNILIHADRGSVRLTATNLEIGVSCLLRGKVESEGSFTVSGKLFSDYVGLLPKDRVDVVLEDKALKITAPGAKTTIRGIPPEEFPLIPQVKRDSTFSVPGSALRSAIARVIFAAASDEARPEISGVLLVVHHKTLTLAATDSYRLAEQLVELPATAKDARIILPSRTLQEILRTLGDESVEISIDENQALFAYNDVEMTTRLIEGQYPDYTQIIPKEHQTTIEIGREDLVNAVKQASLFCKQGIYDVTLESDGEKTLTVRAANTQAGEYEKALTAKTTGAPVSIVFNYRYLLDGLGSLTSESAVLELGGPANPGLIRPQGMKQTLYLIMPIRQ